MYLFKYINFIFIYVNTVRDLTLDFPLINRQNMQLIGKPAKETINQQSHKNRQFIVNQQTDH